VQFCLQSLIFKIFENGRVGHLNLIFTKKTKTAQQLTQQYITAAQQQQSDSNNSNNIQ